MAAKKTYPGNIKQRGDAWRIRLCVGGKYFSFTCNGTKVEAQNLATRKYAELNADNMRRKAGLPGPIRFSALIAEFQELELPTLSAGTVKSYTNSFKPFLEYFADRHGDPFVREIQRSHVKTYMQWRRTHRVGDKDGTVTAFTVARDRRVMHRLFNYALEKDYVDANPCARVRAPRSDPRNPPILTDVQLEALLDAAEQPMLRLYVLFLAETGCRSVSEGLGLRWEDVDIAGGFIHIQSAPGRRTKSGKSRWVPMTPRLRAAMQEHAATYRMALYSGARSDYVFHHVANRRSARAGQRVLTFKGAFRAAIRASNLPAGFRPHDLRHRRITTWLADGKNPVHVKEAVGHASLQTTMGYTHLLPEHLRALVEETPQTPLRVMNAG